MKLTIATTQGVAMGVVKLIEIAPDAPMTSVAELIAVELEIPPANQRLLLNGAPIPISGTAGDRGLSDGDLVLVDNAAPAPPAGRNASAQRLRAILQNPDAMAQLRARDPALARAIESGDETSLAALASQLEQMIAQGRQRGAAPGGTAAAPSIPEDPLSVEAQEAMMERIRQANVEHNMEMAIEHNPEAFGSVVMLFVDCKVNGTPGVKAFVDSGAQATIISKDCAERCNILRLMDTRFQGVARGVGTAKIYGRIHLTLLTLGSEVFEVTFTVMDSVGAGYDMLLGLDMLRKHQATIDLRENCLKIGNAVVTFLQEKDIPKRMREQPGEAVPTSGAASGSPGAGSSGGGHRLGTASTPRVNEQAITKLAELGFSRDESVQALQACGGNADAAASMLTASKYGV